MAEMARVYLGAAGEPEPPTGFLVMVAGALSGERLADFEFEFQAVLIFVGQSLFERKEVEVGGRSFHEVSRAEFDELDFAFEG
jgi:hypothetical protein